MIDLSTQKSELELGCKIVQALETKMTLAAGFVDPADQKVWLYGYGRSQLPCPPEQFIKLLKETLPQTSPVYSKERIVRGTYIYTTHTYYLRGIKMFTDQVAINELQLEKELKRVRVPFTLNYSNGSIIKKLPVLQVNGPLRETNYISFSYNEKEDNLIRWRCGVFLDAIPLVERLGIATIV